MNARTVTNTCKLHARMKVFRIIPEFRIFRLTSIESRPLNAELGRLL